MRMRSSDSIVKDYNVKPASVIGFLEQRQRGTFCRSLILTLITKILNENGKCDDTRAPVSSLELLENLNASLGSTVAQLRLKRLS